MVDHGRIRSTSRPEEIVVDEYSVWINTDIREIEVSFEEDTHTEYEFSQVQYTKNEYIKKIHSLDNALDIILEGKFE